MWLLAKPGRGYTAPRVPAKTPEPVVGRPRTLLSDCSGGLLKTLVAPSSGAVRHRRAARRRGLERHALGWSRMRLEVHAPGQPEHQERVDPGLGEGDRDVPPARLGDLQRVREIAERDREAEREEVVQDMHRDAGLESSGAGHQPARDEAEREAV